MEPEDLITEIWVESAMEDLPGTDLVRADLAAAMRRYAAEQVRLALARHGIEE